MLESAVLMVAGFAFVSTVLMLVSDREQPVFGLFAMILWFISAAAIIQVDVPYSHLYENAADNTYQVVTGTQAVTSAAPLSTLFTGLGFICLGYTIIIILKMLIPSRREMRG